MDLVLERKKEYGNPRPCEHRHFPAVLHHCSTLHLRSHSLHISIIYPIKIYHATKRPRSNPWKWRKHLQVHFAEDRVGAPRYFSTRNHRLCFWKLDTTVFFLIFIHSFFHFLPLFFFFLILLPLSLYLLHSTPPFAFQFQGCLSLSLSLSLSLKRSLTIIHKKWLECFCCLLYVCYQPS